MIVGEHTRDNDLVINVLKGKQLTNIRTTSKDEAVRLTPPIRMTLEKALAYIEDDELVEVTPKSIRLRKKLLDENDRKRADRAQGSRRRSDTSAAKPNHIRDRLANRRRAIAIVRSFGTRSPRVASRARLAATDVRDFGSAMTRLRPRCGQ